MRVLRLCVPLALIAVIGCGDGSVKLPKSPVSGAVTYRGKPLGAGRICFVHQSGQASSADIASDGTFKLDAYQGRNQVVVECLAAEKSVPNSKGKIGFLREESLIPTRYSEPGTSGLTCEVKPGDSKVDFALKD
jgi:hypothetical protein